MEEEVIKTVLNEILEEFKEAKQQQIETGRILFEIKDKVDAFEENINDIKIATSAIDIKPVIAAINSELNKVKDTIAAQPKSIRKEFRILLFPEYNATEYYKKLYLADYYFGW